MFYLQIATKLRADERTRTADLISSYEFACVRPRPFLCVRELRLFRGFSTLWQVTGVRYVLAYSSPVAVRLQYAEWGGLWYKRCFCIRIRRQRSRWARPLRAFGPGLSRSPAHEKLCRQAVAVLPPSVPCPRTRR
jgi:hypothetical protein